ncbi:unnamed protein product [Arctia plantaginis]|uniref:Uncharacterized protein n=1 Tax=Arctia plantaginis TaxID=874455 RepID=A0A8S1B8S8_ARCPL|nr:unnamed protein product [Arctia plantaginis]CAB3256039.1 unnamed protein product [Arctia plantaginis]
MRTIVEAARTVIHARRLYENLRGEAINDVVFTINNTGTSTVKIKLLLTYDLVPTSDDKSSPQEDSDKYDLESRKDFDRTSEKERELRLLRKAKKMKDNSFRRTLESILPAKNSESYRRLLEDLVNNPEEKSKLLRKEAEEVVVPERRVAIDSDEDSDSQVEEIEVIIERLSDDYNENDNSTSKKTLLAEESKSSNSESPPVELQEKSISAVPIEKNERDQSSQNRNDGEDMKERTGQGSTSSAEQLDEHAFLEPYPISRINEVVIPHFRTTLTRSRVIVRPAVYTVQTSSPLVDRVTTRSLLSNRRLLPDIYARLTNNKIGHPNQDLKLIEDYNDYNANAYSYAPTHVLARQMDKNGEALSQLIEGSLKPQLGLLNPYRESLHPAALYSQPQRYLSDGYRPLFRISR